MSRSRKLGIGNPGPQSEYAAFRRIPILVLTALRAPPVPRGGVAKLAADAFVEKPVEPDARVACARQLLENRAP